MILLNSHIEKYAGKIVHIECGDAQGTAFFVSKNIMLSAWHVVSDIKFHEQVYAYIDGKSVECDVEELGENAEGIDYDVVLLKAKDFNLPDDTPVLPLLSSAFHSDAEFEIIGYPQEIGDNSECFQTRIRNSKDIGITKQHSYNCLATFCDTLKFQSYTGFSGSPVINSSGLVIGVATNQLYNSIGYVSIQSLSDKLKSKGIDVDENDILYDDTPYGRAYAISKVNAALSRMKGRYGKIRVDNNLFIENIENFLGLNFEKRKSDLHLKFKEFCTDKKRTKLELNCLLNKKVIKDYFDNGKITDKNKLISELKQAFEEKNKTKEYIIKGEARSIFENWIYELLDIDYYDKIRKEQFKLILGEAGCGKTHSLCRFADVYKERISIYLFFGMDFGEATPDETIMRIMEWSDPNYLKSINDKMESAQQNALFIIDAINEGVGDSYWRLHLQAFRHNIRQYKHIKLILSVRTLGSKDAYQGLFENTDYNSTLTINGFENIQVALQEFFGKYGIKDDIDGYKNILGFYNPLFLKLFCDSYFQLSPEERKNPNLLTIYDRYLHIKNREISQKIGEDEYRNVLLLFLKRIALRSVESYQCGDVPNKVARKISYSICSNRTWHSSLMYQCLVENLLFRYGQTDDYGWVNFEFQQIGDFLKAEQIMLSNSDYNSIIQYFERNITNSKNSRISNRSLEQTLIAFLSIWNPPQEIWNLVLKKEWLTPYIILSLKYRNFEQSGCTLTPEHIANCIIYDPRYINAQFIIKHAYLFSSQILDSLHNSLLNIKTISERDEKWSVSVNQLYDNYIFQSLIDNFEDYNKVEIHKVLILESWMLTSSHPAVRHNIIRRMKKHFEQNAEMCITLIDNFHKVNDYYILRGLYAAIYGTILCKRDNFLTENVAKKVYDSHYSNSDLIPQDIEVRHWTLKILEYAYAVNKQSNYWEKVTPPFECKIKVLENTESIEEDYFGPGAGATEIKHSLFDWDFSHYIIGTNFSYDSGTYYKKGEPVKLGLIEKATAKIIKQEYGYNDTLDAYDSKLAWEECTPRKHERFGKKYEWLALGKVKAYLCDTCDMRIDDWTDEYAEVPYPWYDDYGIHFDPTIDSVNFELQEDINLFDREHNEESETINYKKWLEDKQYLLPLRSIVKDNKGDEWVILFGYDHYSEEFENRDNFTFYNTCLVKREYSKKFSDWASKQNFYGRWMPEGAESYDFLWKEYPWADSCIKSLSFDSIKISEDCPCNVYMPCVRQFQENQEEINEFEHFNSTVVLPRKDLYDYLNVYNAERGVFRENGTDKIVAINRDINDDSLDVFLIRREKLNNYLDTYGYDLFYCLLAEKRVENQENKYELRRYSSCLHYIKDAKPDIIQPWMEENEFDNKNN